MRLTGERFDTEHRSPRGLHAPASALAEVGSFALEFLAAAYHSGDGAYTVQLDAAMRAIDGAALDGLDGLFPNRFHSATREPASEGRVSMGALGDSFYEYLLKRWIHSEMMADAAAGDGGQGYLRRWTRAMDSMIEHMVHTSEDGYTYIADLATGQGAGPAAAVPRMEHLTCFVPGMLALGVYHAGRLADDELMGADRSAAYMRVAEGVARTCFAMYATSGRKGLAPEYVRFGPGMSVRADGRFYALRPEAIESFFYLFRVTGDIKYRAYAYAIYRSIRAHHRSHDSPDDSICGFSVVDDVTYARIAPGARTRARARRPAPIDDRCSHVLVGAVRVCAHAGTGTARSRRTRSRRTRSRRRRRRGRTRPCRATSSPRRSSTCTCSSATIRRCCRSMRS